MAENDESSKYGDRSLRDLFRSQFESDRPQSAQEESPKARIRRVHSHRDEVQSGELPHSIRVEEILEHYGATHRDLPVQFSQSAASYDPALPYEEHFNRYTALMPATKAFADQRLEAEEKDNELLEKLRGLNMEEALAHSEEYIQQARSRLPIDTLHAIRHDIEFFRDEQPEIKAFVRHFLEDHPEVQRETGKDASQVSFQDMVQAVQKHPEELSRSEMRILGRYIRAHEIAGTAFAQLLYPDDYRQYARRGEEAAILAQDVQAENREYKGYRPPEMIREAKRQLSERHGIDAHTVDESYVGVCNGSSIYVMQGALSAKIKRGQALITPELHFDGYDFIASGNDFKLMEKPRDVSMRDYMKKHFPEGDSKKIRWSGAWGKKASTETEPGGILVTNPCSITGKELNKEELREYLKIAKDYDIPIVFNEIMASPDAQGKTFESITKLPEYQDVKDKIMIVSSISKTSHIPDSIPKFSYFMTADKQWGARTSASIEMEHGRAFDREDVSNLLAYMPAVDSRYLSGNEKVSSQKRDRIEGWLEKINASAGKEVVKWYDGRPEKGYISSIEFDPKLLQQAGIHDCSELFEYLYKVGGVSAGVLIPTTKEGGGKDRMGIRVNYSFDDKKLDLGFALIEHSVNEMQRGLTLDEARQMCPNNTSPLGNSLMEMLLRGAGGGRVIFVDASRFK